MSETAQTGVAETRLELNPSLDDAGLADAFRSKGRLHIPNVLTKPSADRIYRCLTHETNWSLTFNKDGNFMDIPNVSADERSRLAFSAWQRARTGGFAYFFDNHRLSVDGEPYPDPSRYHARVVTFLNSPSMLGFIRKVTGLSAIERTDAQATLYRPGDFLTMHDDETGGRKRLAAYVLNMTPAWSPDWGGILQFVGNDGHIQEGFVPCFNALNIFRVPALHCVTQVSLFGGMRYSVTGWFHAH